MNINLLMKIIRIMKFYSVYIHNVLLANIGYGSQSRRRRPAANTGALSVLTLSQSDGTAIRYVHIKQQNIYRYAQLYY